MTKQLAQHPVTGYRDIASVQCWETVDGKVRPQLTQAPDCSRTFCDNLTLWATDLYIPLRFLECFDLTNRADGDAGNRFSISVCGIEHDLRITVCTTSKTDSTLIRLQKRHRKFKVMLCGVPLSVIRSILRVLQFSTTLSLEELNDDKKLAAKSRDFKNEHWSDFHPKKLLPALRFAIQLVFIDMDITTDYKGTLCIPRLEEVIQGKGWESVSHACGKNMIRLAPIISQVRTVKVKSQGKYYNKIFETLSSAYARNKEVGQKLYYLLNPSTPNLKDTIRSFCSDGVSRFESTHSCAEDDSLIPDLDDMLRIHDDLAYPLKIMWMSTLVKCSIQEHLEHIESKVESSFATFFPHMNYIKSTNLKSGNVSTNQANKEPEGAIVHYYNSEAGRFIGNHIHSQLKRYGSARTEGFQLLAKNLAWGSLCGQSPVLAVCVAGPKMCLRDGKICTDKDFDVHRAFYFRVFEADCVFQDTAGPASTGDQVRSMLLAGSTGVYSGKGSLRFQDTDMG